MAFRKVGRPAEDRLGRQCEIYLEVAPLLQCTGVRGLSMRAAARAACVSVGGLYYYFPTKRDLVLHGLQPEVITRFCTDRVDTYTRLAEIDPSAYSRVVLDHFHDLVVGFVRPAYDAAVELGPETMRAQVRRTLEEGLGHVVDLMRPLASQLDEAQLAALGEGLLRLTFSVLLYRATPPEHFRRELDALISVIRRSIGVKVTHPSPRASTPARKRRVILGKDAVRVP